MRLKLMVPFKETKKKRRVPFQCPSGHEFIREFGGHGLYQEERAIAAMPVWQTTSREYEQVERLRAQQVTLYGDAWARSLATLAAELHFVMRHHRDTDANS